MDNKLNLTNQISSQVVGKAFVISAYQEQNIKQAAKRIKQGKLVSFPTETVYGLGANALDPKAAIKIFNAKERPLTDPLILHVCDTQSALKLVNISDQIKKFFQFITSKLWPGPLTVVMRANDEVIDDIITAGTGYVGIRRPSHPIASKLIQYSELPIAAPSANKFGHVSPTKPQHVMKDFIDNDVLVLDGGSCSVGIQSTIIKLIQTDSEGDLKIYLLRRGGISQQMLRQLLEESQAYKQTQLIAQSLKSHNEQNESQCAPGQFLRHYAPNIESYIFVNEANPHLLLQGSQVCQDAQEILNEELKQDEKISLKISKSVLIDFGGRFQEFQSQFKAYIDLSVQGNYKQAMLNIYDYLRWAETYQDADKVLITQLNQTMDSKQNQHFDALYDKIFRATSGRKIQMHHQDINLGKLVYLAK